MALLALKTYAGGAACVGAGFGVAVCRGAAEVVADAVIDACVFTLGAVDCTFGRPDDEAGGRCADLVAPGVGWAAAARAGAVVTKDVFAVARDRVPVSEADA